MIKKLVLATHNEGKVAEFEKLLAGLVGHIKSAADFGLDAPEETGATFEENASIKAAYVAGKTGLPTLADDSGLCVTALNGDPGVYTADWAGEPRDFNKAMALVNEKLGGAKDRSAYFAAILALAMPNGNVEFFEGKILGSAVWPPRGLGDGFGYDPIFMPEGSDKTFAEMPFAEKNRISHRARAVEKLKAWLAAQP